MIAELCVPERFDPRVMTKDLVMALLQQAGVLITDEVCASVERALAEAVQGVASRSVIATSKPPVHGDDGWVEWLIEGLEDSVERDAATPGEEAADSEPAAPETDEALEESDHRSATSHYNRSSFVMVEAGAVLARIHPPTLGEDGHDVRGKIRAARQGKPAPLVLDESVSVNSSGMVTAEVNGAVTRVGNLLSVRNVLDIPGCVDFSTGNIEFDGSVRIHKDIKDLFVVSCNGSLEVGGLIEAATLNCTGGLIARGGMAGRGRGKVACGGDAQGRYFDGVHLEIGGTLRFERELINCTTRVHGHVDSATGSIIGGALAVAGSVLVANLGSRGGAITRITLGSIPNLTGKLAELDALIDEVIERDRASATELRLLSEPGRRLTPEQIERQTELIFYAQVATQNVQKLQAAREAVLDRIAELSCVDVRVERTLYHGVRLIVGDYEYRILKETRGPLRITRASDGALMYQIGSGNRVRHLAELGEARLINQEAA
jgi:uncharacterized protein (DUF342 family)